ncbi:MAG: AcrB/AcrD/AcrF family protein, partial [Alphaproteobacteria bacterium]|nr:AcrB/AcrD/AcrF family protein [Alphaproteobacteria bacterium]
VLGLAPLLYESSSQAQFLKPTVITLVYGLGFGLVLVMLVVPSLLAMQHDVGRQVQSLRRSLRAGAALPGVLLATGLGIVAAVALFAATLGAVLVTGALPAPLAELLPAVVQGSTGVAFALYLALLLPVLFVIWAVSALRMGRRARG